MLLIIIVGSEHQIMELCIGGVPIKVTAIFSVFFASFKEKGVHICTVISEVSTLERGPTVYKYIYSHRYLQKITSLTISISIASRTTNSNGVSSSLDDIFS